jgi:hypothetical protein
MINGINNLNHSNSNLTFSSKTVTGQDFREVLSSFRQNTATPVFNSGNARDTLIRQGTNVPLSYSMPVALLERIQQQQQQASKCDTDEMRDKLRAKFDIPVIVTGSEEDDIPHWAKSPTGGTLRIFRISKEMLRKMEDDPEVFHDITERMQRFQDGLCEFIKNHDGIISNIEMYIDVNGIGYGYTEDFDAPSEKVAKAKSELNALIDFFIRWLGERNKNNVTEETEEGTNESKNIKDAVTQTIEYEESIA